MTGKGGKAPEAPATTTPAPSSRNAPNPAALLAAVLVAGVLVTNMLIDGDKYLSLALVVVFAAVLGVDVSRFLTRGGPGE